MREGGHADPPQPHKHVLCRGHRPVLTPLWVPGRSQHGPSLATCTRAVASWAGRGPDQLGRAGARSHPCARQCRGARNTQTPGCRLPGHKPLGSAHGHSSVPTQPGPPWAWEASAHLSPTALPSPALVAQPGGWHLPCRSWFSPESHQSLSAPESRGTFWAFPKSKMLKRRSYLHDTPYPHQVPITGLLAGFLGRDGRWPLRTVGQAQA